MAESAFHQSGAPMSRVNLGVVVNGATGRMGYRQHLVRSLLAIQQDGGVPLPGGTVIWPEPLLVGRSVDRVKAVAERHDLRWTTSLDLALSDPDADVYFDAQVTGLREAALLTALAAGKHVYTEKPTADSVAGALRVARAARDAGVVHGVVMDKLFLPGLRKLRRLVDGGFFGRICSVRIDFGYWVFEGDWQPAQRPSWNYRAEDVPAQWGPVPDNEVFDNAFKAQWELFLRHVVDGTPFRHDLFDGARGVQLAHLALQSAREGRRLPVPELP